MLAFRLATDAEDPLLDAPASLPCAPVDTRFEGETTDSPMLEVTTNACGRATFVQETAAPIARGELIHVTLWHGLLRAADPAEGHLALWLDGELLWETFPAIPGDPAVYTVDLPAPKDVATGATFAFHVHNHGVNDWNLAGLEVRDAR
ncbi:MAG: hypothetical protein FJ104_00635 [Deltaproteobacteria bacterium]|nr:hypothetical protein [Deltaproteobacteria bacterium]